MIARMWEVRAQPGAVEALVEWVYTVALPSIEDKSGHLSSQVYASDDRVVVISSWRGKPRDLPEAPPGLVARSPHAWNFNLIDRESDTDR